MDHDIPNPIKPKRRWFQYRLRSLLLLPVVVGLLLVLYLYWDEWRKHRPPFQDSKKFVGVFLLLCFPSAVFLLL